MRIALIILFALFVQMASAQNYYQHRRRAFQTAVSVGSNPPSSPLVNQNFEGTGDDNSETWTDGGFGTKNHDFTPALLGGESLQLDIGDSLGGGTTVSFTGGAERWGFCRLKISVSRDSDFIRFFSSGFATEPFSVGVHGTKFRITCGGVTADTSDSFSLDTEYYMWWRYKNVSAGASEGQVWFSANSTKPSDGTGPTATITTGTSITDAAILGLYPSSVSGSSFTAVFDHVYVDDAAILSNP